MGRSVAYSLPGGFGLGVGVACVEQIAGEVRKGLAAGKVLQLGQLVRGEFTLQAGEPAGEGGQGVGVDAAHGDVVEHLLEGFRRLAVEGTGIGLVLFADAHSVDDDEAVLALWRWGDGAQPVRRDDADAPALHLLEEAGRFHVSHEEHALDRFHVRAGGDHVHGDGDAREEAVAEVGEDLVRGQACGLHPFGHLGLGSVPIGHRFCDPGEAGAVGDLPAEVVAFAELHAGDADDILRVGIVLGEDQGLWHLFASRERLGQHLVAELPQHGADLAFRNHVAVELVGAVGEVVVEAFQPLLAGQLVASVHVDFRVTPRDGGTLLRDLRSDAVHVEVNVDAVDHRFVMAVLHDEVLIEEADGFSGGVAVRPIRNESK